MYAIIEACGRQFKVAPGDSIRMEKLEAEVGSEVVFDKVIIVCDKTAKVGAPYVKGVTVTGKVVKHDKNAKVVIFKYKSKANIRRKTGHRQPYTQVLIESINI